MNTQSTPEGQSIARGLLQEMAALALRFGEDPEFARGGGGNVSVKADGVLYIKPSGTSLAARAARRLARAWTGRAVLFPLDDDAVERYASRAVFVIERARRELGFAPRVDLATGLATLAAAGCGGG